jgi:hypothetical protein
MCIPPGKILGTPLTVPVLYIGLKNHIPPPTMRNIILSSSSQALLVVSALWHLAPFSFPLFHSVPSWHWSFFSRPLGQYRYIATSHPWIFV